MTSTTPIESFTDRTTSAVTTIGVYRIAIALALSLSAGLLALSALFSLFEGEGGDAAAMATVGAVCGIVGFLNLRRPFSTAALRPVSTMAAAVLAFVAVAAVSTIVYLLTGTLDRVDDALYESVAGVSTSALTIFDDPAVVGDGVLVWRSATQWLGGLGALSLAVGLLPFLGGSRELAGGPQRARRTSAALATRPIVALKRVGVIYLIVTVAVIFALLIVGMGLRDGVAHALSTVSTGGFSTHAGSIGHFDSLAVELVLILAMLGASSSVAFAWMIWRRAFGDTRRAFELQTYFAVIAASTLWIWWLRRDEVGVGVSEGFREALFTVVSMSSTTGYRIAEWGSWHPGATTLLLVLLVVGGTAGSASGGLRWIRILGLAQFVWRELQRQLHPRSIRSVKVGRTLISEASVDRMHAQMVYVMTLGAFASLILALFGEGITEAITLTISAISTAGPGFDDTGGISTAAELTRPERGVLMPVMLTGRVFLYPAVLAVGAGLTAIGRALRPGMG